MDSLNKNNQLHLVETKNWADLPYDIIELVLKKLHFTAQIRFGAVFRSWQRVSKNCSTSCSYRRPWVITNSRFQTKNDFACQPYGCTLFDPYSQKSYTISNPIIHENLDFKFGGTRVCASKNGWLLLSLLWLRRGTGICHLSLFFHNPFSNDVISLPDLDPHYYTATFTTNPTFPECEVFVVKTRICKNNGIVHNIYNICLSKDRVWSIGTPHISQNNHEITSVHYMKGKLYCLFEGGLLKSYTLANKSWEVLAPSLPAWINLDLDPTKCWLIEIGENLMTVCTSFELENELKWSVFKFDWSRMSWILETSLKNTALFISGNISFSATLLDVNGENNLEDYRVNFFDDCHDVHAEHKLMYPKEYSWIEETNRVMTFIEPPYVRK